VIEMRAFEELLAPAACALVARRREGATALGELTRGFYSELTGGVEEGVVEYEADVAGVSPDEFFTMLERQRPRDTQLRGTQRGPHRDDLHLRVGGQEAALFASEGQQRALVLALRFAQLRDARRRTGVAPLVLADDVLGELDPVRRVRFWAALDRDVQLFASGTSLPETDAGSWQTFRVHEGRFERT
jgi:DNA replication and repair protein RecF